MSNCCTPSFATPVYPNFPPPSGAASSPSAAAAAAAATDPNVCPDYLKMPTVKQTFTLPAILGTGQFYSQCAYLWAVAGASIFLPPFGIVKILGVTGEVITYQNLSVIAGTSIEAGTLLLQGAPQVSQSSQPQGQLDRLAGFLNGAASDMGGAANQLLRWNQVGGNIFLQPTSGMIFHPNPQYANEIAAEDVGGAAANTTPIDTAGTGVTAYYDLPNLPTYLPASFWVAVHLRLSVAAVDTVAANAFTAEHNSVEVASMTYQFAENTHFIVPVTGTQLQLIYTKLNAKANCFARVRIAGYFY